MELFGGLLKPGEAGVIALRRELERRRDTWPRSTFGSDAQPPATYVYRGGADMCLRHGRSFKGRVCPEEYRDLVGPNGRCYANALAACQAHPELRYFEGYYSWGRGHFTSHGWAVAPDDGVVELSIETWLLDEFHGPDGQSIMPAPTWTYWGVEFGAELVDWHLHDDAGPHELPMLDRTRDDFRDDRARSRGLDMTQSHDFPILKVSYDPGRTQL
jgi:hypothetical protein